MISSNYNKGFTMTFKNGLTISVQFGRGNYCENRFSQDHKMNTPGTVSSNDAEIAIWDSDGVDFNFGSDENQSSVVGFMDSDEVSEWIQKVKSAESIKSLGNTKLTLEIIRSYGFDWSLCDTDCGDTAINFETPNGFRLFGFTVIDNESIDTDELNGLDSFISIRTVQELDEFLKLSFGEVIEKLDTENVEFDKHEYL